MCRSELKGLSGAYHRIMIGDENIVNPIEALRAGAEISASKPSSRA
jgi:hypothetical protein